MKIKFILLALFIVFTAASCYLANGNDAANGGSLAFKINAPMRSPGTAPGQDGEIRIKFFEAGDMQEGKDYEIGTYGFPANINSIPGNPVFEIRPAIFYLTKPTPININGRNVITTYFKDEVAGTATVKGTTEIDNIPAGISLRAVVEYNYYNGDYDSGGSLLGAPSGSYILYGRGKTSYISYVGVSEPFTVKKGSSTLVEMGLNEAAFGTASFDFPQSFLQSVTNFNTIAIVVFMDPDEFSSKFRISGNQIICNSLSISQDTAIAGSLLYYCAFSGTDFQNLCGNPKVDMLPGKKLKLMIFQYSSFYAGTLFPAGLSKTFELAPGLTQRVDLDWSYTTTDFC